MFYVNPILILFGYNIYEINNSFILITKDTIMPNMPIQAYKIENTVYLGRDEMATLNDLQQLIEQVDTAPDKCAHLFMVTRTKINNERVFDVYQPEINEDISDSFIDLFLQFMRKALKKNLKFSTTI